MSTPKIPQVKMAAPSTPVRMDDPAVMAVRQESMRRGANSGYMSTVLTPMDAQPPSVQMKRLLGL
jgi:hypothetical protein